MDPYSSGTWSDFASAHIGASSALLGLVFVGLSLNLSAILRAPQLVDRAAEAVVLLGAVLATSTAVLVPAQARLALGLELLVLGGVGLAAVAVLQRRIRETASATPRAAILLRRVCGLGAPVLVSVAGVSLLVEAGGGLYWWPAAIVLAYLGALVGAWVLLVEILR